MVYMYMGVYFFTRRPSAPTKSVLIAFACTGELHARGQRVH